jgi:hypothetical protein
LEIQISFFCDAFLRTVIGFFWQTLARDIRTIGMAGSTWKARFVLTWPDVSVMWGLSGEKCRYAARIFWLHMGLQKSGILGI